MEPLLRAIRNLIEIQQSSTTRGGVVYRARSEALLYCLPIGKGGDPIYWMRQVAIIIQVIGQPERRRPLRPADHVMKRSRVSSKRSEWDDTTNESGVTDLCRQTKSEKTVGSFAAQSRAHSLFDHRLGQVSEVSALYMIGRFGCARQGIEKIISVRFISL